MTEFVVARGGCYSISVEPLFGAPPLADAARRAAEILGGVVYEDTYVLTRPEWERLSDECRCRGTGDDVGNGTALRARAVRALAAETPPRACAVSA